MGGRDIQGPGQDGVFPTPTDSSSAVFLAKPSYANAFVTHFQIEIENVRKIIMWSMCAGRFHWVRSKSKRAMSVKAGPGTPAAVPPRIHSIRSIKMSVSVIQMSMSMPVAASNHARTPPSRKQNQSHRDQRPSTSSPVHRLPRRL